MNRTKLKKYAPKARRDFIQAVTDRAAFFGLTANTGPTRTTAEVFGIGSPPLVEVSVRAPAH